MQLGFIGTGAITSSIVTGLCSSRGSPHSVRLSPRNRAVAEELANRFNGISIASCNQEVLDHCDTIVVAVRPAIARGVLSELRFRPDHQVISLVSALTLGSLSDLAAPVGANHKGRATAINGEAIEPHGHIPTGSGRA